jgi:ferredoxin
MRFMSVEVNRFKCAYCGACVGVCPKGALELVETWIEVDDSCTKCGACAKICPVGALEVKSK